MSYQWKKTARKEGRVCPKCLQPVSRKEWGAMGEGKMRNCHECRYVEQGLNRHVGCAGSVERDNIEFADLDSIEDTHKAATLNKLGTNQ
jgi:hypothetical protein